MNIAMTGATGYIGKHLSNYLTEKGGHRIIPLGRAMFREGMSGLLVQTLTHCDVIINLAGAPINQRWTPEHKQELFNSRITVTHRIIRALNAVKTKPKLMISEMCIRDRSQIAKIYSVREYEHFIFYCNLYHTSLRLRTVYPLID